MKIGIMIAIKSELEAFLKYARESDTPLREEKVGNRPVWFLDVAGHTLLAMLSGYGEIDAAAATQLLITWGGCEVVLNFGVAGALDPDLQVKDLFVVRRICHYDYDVSPIDPVRKHQYEEFPDEFIPLDEGLIALARQVMPELKETSVASGDRFVEDREDKRKLAALGCQLCDMESAAIARICAVNGVRCLSIKCISDTFDGNGGDFWTNVKHSAELAFRVLLNLIKEL